MKSCFLVLFLVASLCLSAQETSKIELSTEEKREDFEMFLSIMKSVNPQLTLRKKITGFDLIEYIEKQRQAVDTVCTEEFILMLVDALRRCNDPHNTYITNDSMLDIFDNDTAKATKYENLMTAVDEYLTTVMKKEDRERMPLCLFYSGGEYYSIGKLAVADRLSGIVADSIPQGAKVISVGGEPIDSVLQRSWKLNFTNFSWDKVRHRPYWAVTTGEEVWGIHDDGAVDIVYEYKGEIRKFIYKLTDGQETRLAGGAYFFNDWSVGYVDYFPESKLLYIRLPQMANKDFYLKEIIAKGRGKSIGKVVIDIRNNPGGDDGVWMGILETLIAKPLDIRARVGYKNTELAIKRLKLTNGKREAVKVPLLDNEEYGTLLWGEVLQPSDSSLNFTGNIYVLQNRLIFSSAGSLSNVAKMHKNIISVGETTGNLLGFGFAPLTFVLPNSCFVFQIEPVLDLSNAKTLYDYFHDNVEIPVEISVEQVVKNFNNYNPDRVDKYIYSKDFLYNHDPVFRKVLKMK